MATRRKYKVQHFRDGGRVLQDMPIADDAPAEAGSSSATRGRFEDGGFPTGILGDAPPAATTQQPPSAESSLATEHDNPLMHALAAQQRAEQMHAQQPQRSAIEQRIEKIPGLTDHKKNLLRQFPVIVEDPVVGQMFNRHYQAGLQSGLGDDTPELDHYLIANVVSEIEQRDQHRRQLESEDVAVQRLDDEAAAHLRSYAPAPIAPPSKPPAPRRLMQISAPVTREVPMISGERRQENTLNQDERFIAHTSFPHLPKPQAEYEYLKNKRLMIQRKASGEIQGDY